MKIEKVWYFKIFTFSMLDHFLNCKGTMSGLIPTHLWDADFEKRAEEHPGGTRGILALGREDGTCFHYSLPLLPHE